MSDRNTGTCIFFLFFNEFSPNLKYIYITLKQQQRHFLLREIRLFLIIIFLPKKISSFFLRKPTAVTSQE